MIKLKYLLEVLFVISLSFPLALIPNKISQKVGDLLGLFVFYIWRSRRKIALDNIKKVFPDNHYKICKETFRNLGISLIEVIKIYYGLGSKIIEGIQIKGIENYNIAKSKSKGIIFISGHCGNWELMALTLAFRIEGASLVARQQNNPYLDKIIGSIRAKFGNKVIYKQGALKKILLELKQNRSVGILMDQSVLENEGYIIDFLGKPAWTTKMPALIARKTNAPVIPLFINRHDGKHIINFCPEVILSEDKDFEKALIEDTKRFSKYIEDYIRQNPSEWLWIHRRWKRV